MINIELKPKRKRGNDDPYPYLVINGVADTRSFVFGKKGELLSAHLYDPRVGEILMEERIQDLQLLFSNLEVPYEVEWNDYFSSVSIDFRKLPRKKFPSIDIEFVPDFEQWAKPYSIVEYAEVIERAIKAKNRRGLTFFQRDEIISAGFGLRCRISSHELTLKEGIERCILHLKDICEATEKILMSSARRNSLTTFFNFPPSTRTACEQYLIYFIQFLDDLGIKADAEIKEDAQRVLFSVTPADGPTALTQIREALDLYLRLPGMPEFSTKTLATSDVASQQLQANVLHLQSQLTLAQAVLAAKDAAIDALQISNFQYRQLISSEQETKRDEEALIGDTIHVTKVDTKGLSVDLPLILRRLKRRFGWDKK